MARTWMRTKWILFCCLAASAGAAAAQQSERDEAPRVRRVTFRGVESVDRAELREGIHTRPTRCRSLLAQPFCWATDSGLWKEKSHLDPAEVERDELRVRVFYFQRGYRETQVTSEIVPRGGAVDVVFTVQEGLPTTLRQVTVAQTREVLGARDVERARFPGEGDPLNLPRVDSAVRRLGQALAEQGFLDAVVRDTLLVDAAARTASLEVTVQAGGRATVGDIRITGNEQVEESVIRTALDLREGDVIRMSRLLGSQRNLYESDLFRLARVVVPPQADTAKLIRVEVREARLRTVRTGLGINNVDFVQAEAGYTHNDFGGGGKRMDVQATLGNLLADQLNGSGIFTDVVPSSAAGVEEEAFLRPTWQASVSLSLPGFRSNLANTVSGSVFAHRRTVPGVAVDRGYGASAT